MLEGRTYDPRKTRPDKVMFAVYGHIAVHGVVIVRHEIIEWIMNHEIMNRGLLSISYLVHMMKTQKF